MKKHNKFLAANLALTLAAASIIGYGKWKEGDLREDRTREVQQIVSRYRSCPDSYRTTGECYNDAERTGMANTAREHSSAGRYLQAGLIYARLGRDFINDAREMAGRCDETGRRQILREIGLRSEAARRMGPQ
ncbi:MAG: hypothetical protein U0R44_02230 [Candidatus Micrarchaeia archaeon]